MARRKKGGHKKLTVVGPHLGGKHHEKHMKGKKKAARKRGRHK